MAAIYTCGSCGRSVTKTTRVCPHCGARLSGIKCQSCGFVGTETDFTGDRCPKCRSVVCVSSQQSTTAAAVEICKGCGRSKKSSDRTCPYCGYTQWASIIVEGMLAIGLLFLAWVGLEEPLCTWGSVIAGVVLLIRTIDSVSKALKTPRDAKRGRETGAVTPHSTPVAGNKKPSPEQARPTVARADNDSKDEITDAIEEAERNLFQSLDPSYGNKLSDRLLRSPQTTLQAIRRRGWAKRGTAEPANAFLLRVLGRIYNETDDSTRDEAVDVLVSVFTTPDDNTTGWTDLLETATKVLADYDIREARSKLEALRRQLSGTSIRAIDFALKSLKDISLQSLQRCASCEQQVQPIVVGGKPYCPNCGVSWVGSRVPEKREPELPETEGSLCPHCGNTTSPVIVAGNPYCPECGLRL